MKSDWKFGILDDAVDKGSSNISLNKIKDDDGEFPVFGAKGFAQNVSFYQQENQYLAIIKDGAGIGRVSIHPEKSSVLATMQYILPKQSYDIKFLYYFLNSIDFNKYRTGSTIPHIYYKNYKLEPFPLVSKEEQKQIVAKLDQCFEAIDKAKANAAKNLENAKELFQSKLNDIFSQKGEGWVEKRLIDISKFIDYRGRTPKKTTEGVRLITAKNVKMGILNRNPQEFIHTDDYDDWMTRGIPNRNDVLFTTEAPLANVALLDTDERVALAQRIITLSVDQDIISGEYLCYCMQSKYVQDKILAKGTGATVTGIKAKLLKEIGIPVVDHKTQAKFVNNLNKLKEQTQSLESKYQQELNSLEELKKSILQKAFEGEL